MKALELTSKNKLLKKWERLDSENRTIVKDTISCFFQLINYAYMAVYRILKGHVILFRFQRAYDFRRLENFHFSINTSTTTKKYNDEANKAQTQWFFDLLYR